MGGPALAVGLIRAAFQFILMLGALGLIVGLIGGIRRFMRGFDLPPDELRHRRVMRGPDSAGNSATDPE